MIELRPYQNRIIDEVKAGMLAGHKSILVQMATGAGKTATAAKMISGSQEKGKRIFFTVHRKDLLAQTAAAFREFEIPFSYIASGYPFNPHGKVFICGIDTLKNRLNDEFLPDLIFPDECHMANSDGWDRVLNFYKQRGAWSVGLTATPWRLDGSGLGRNFSHMVQGPSMRWLIDNGYLSEFRYFSPTTIDMSGVRVTMGDYNRNDLAEKMSDDSVIVGDAIKYYLKLSRNKRAICYCISRERSENVAQKFRDAGISAQHIDGETEMPERRRIITAYANGEIDILCNVDLITTGFDLAAQVGRDITVETIILLRPTKSLSLYLQMVGRGLRPKREPAIILDHANCSSNHGLPDDDRVWSLMDRKRLSLDLEEREIPVKTCPKCAITHRPAPLCPICGYIYPVQYREVDEIDGELDEITPEQRRKRRALLQEDDNQRLEELIREAERRGYRNPTAWAAKQFTAHKIAGRRS